MKSSSDLNPASKNSNNRLVGNLLKMLLAAALVWFVLSKTDLAQLLALQERISLPWLVAGFLLFVCMTMLKALQYYYLIEPRVEYPHVLNVVVIQNAVSNFIATGAGIASYLTLFRVEQGVKVRRAVLVFLLAKVGDLISIWFFMLISSLLLWRQIIDFQNWIVLSLVFLGIVIVLFFLAVLFRQSLAKVLSQILEKTKLLRIGFIAKIMDFFFSLTNQNQAFIFRMVGIGSAFSLIYMTVTMMWLYASLMTFSFQIGFLPVVFTNTFMQLVSYLPIQVFGGLGVNEATMLYLYGIFPVSQPELAAVLIGVRILFYLMNLVVLLYLPIYTIFFNAPSRTKE